MGFGAPLAVALPFVANLLRAIAVGEIPRSEPPDAGRREQQGIFDPRAEVAQPLAAKTFEEILLLLVRRRHQQALEQSVHVGAVERPLGARIVGDGEDGRIERTPQ